MAERAAEFRQRPSYSPEPRQHQKPHSAYQGGWRHSEVQRWLGKAESHSGLLNAVNFESPPRVCQNSSIPPETCSTASNNDEPVYKVYTKLPLGVQYELAEEFFPEAFTR